MSDRDRTHEDAVNGGADAQAAEGLDGARSGDDVELFDDEFDSETAALLGASLRPVTPPAAIEALEWRDSGRARADGGDEGAATAPARPANDGDRTRPLTSQPWCPARRPEGGAQPMETDPIGGAEHVRDTSRR